MMGPDRIKEAGVAWRLIKDTFSKREGLAADPDYPTRNASVRAILVYVISALGKESAGMQRVRRCTSKYFRYIC